MAFTTEFVMGAVGSVEEIPVSMSGGDSGNTYPLATVDAGDGAIILVAGTMSPGSTNSSNRPHLLFGSITQEWPHPQLTGPDGPGVGVLASGSVAVEIRSRTASSTTFTGTVYVARL